MKSNLNLNCIDNYSIHLEQTKFNFKKETNVIFPFIDVSANIIKGSVDELNFKNKFDIIFTCTVLMHIPFFSAIEIIKKLASLSKNYIIHIENLSGCIVMGKTRNSFQKLSIDYVKLYKLLGFDIKLSKIINDPNVPSARYGYYIFQKNN